MQHENILNSSLSKANLVISPPPFRFSSSVLSKEMSIIPSFFSPDIWDPFESSPFNTLSEYETSATANTRIDWKETSEAHVFKADLPGVKKEDVKVEVEEGRVLQISGERGKEQEEKNGIWHRMERSVGKFLRRFSLPEDANVDQVKASMENGVLTVTVPKEEAKKPDVKLVDISG